MKTYLHIYGLTNGETWSFELRAINWKFASKYGNMDARAHARREHTHVQWQTTKYIKK